MKRSRFVVGVVIILAALVLRCGSESSVQSVTRVDDLEATGEVGTVAGVRLTDVAAGPTVTSGAGDPNGVITAPIGSVRLQSDTAQLWQNTDGATTWTAAASSSFRGARVTQNVATSTATSTWTSIAWQTESYDTDDYHDTVVNNNRITIPVGLSGFYAVGCELKWASNNVGLRILTIRINAGATPSGGGTIVAQHMQGFTGGVDQVASGVYFLSAGDEIQCIGWQGSGGNLNATDGLGAAESFWVTYMGTVGGGGSDSTFSGASVNSNSGTTSAAHNTLTLLPFDTEQYDTDGYHDPVTNNSRLTAPVTGYYRITYGSQFAANVTGIRQLQVRMNANGNGAGGTEVTNTKVNAAVSTVTIVEGSHDVFMTAGDYVELFGFQTSGVALNVSSTTSVGSFQIALLGD